MAVPTADGRGVEAVVRAQLPMDAGDLFQEASLEALCGVIRNSQDTSQGRRCAPQCGCDDW